MEDSLQRLHKAKSSVECIQVEGKSYADELKEQKENSQAVEASIWIQSNTVSM